MANKKIVKKQKPVKKAAPKKAVRIKSKGIRSKESRIVSFFIGVVTVAALAFVVFQYAKNNNYKTVLGTKTQILKQTPK